MKKLLAVMFVVLVIVVVVVTRKPAPQLDADPTPAMSDVYSVFVRNQETGTHLTVDVVHMAEPGFAIARATGGATSFDGEFLGATALLAAGETTDAGMSLSRSMQPDERVFVILYDDTNDSGAYEDGVDQPALDSSGNRVYTIAIAFAPIQAY